MYNIFAFLIVWLDIGFIVVSANYILNHLIGHKKQKELFDALLSDRDDVCCYWIAFVIGNLFSIVTWPEGALAMVKKTCELIKKKQGS